MKKFLLLGLCLGLNNFSFGMEKDEEIDYTSSKNYQQWAMDGSHEKLAKTLAMIDPKAIVEGDTTVADTMLNYGTNFWNQYFWNESRLKVVQLLLDKALPGITQAGAQKAVNSLKSRRDQFNLQLRNIRHYQRTEESEPYDQFISTGAYIRAEESKTSTQKEVAWEEGQIAYINKAEALIRAKFPQLSK